MGMNSTAGIAFSNLLFFVLAAGSAYLILGVVCLVAGYDLWKMSPASKSMGVAAGIGNVLILAVFSIATPSAIRILATPIAGVEVAFSVLVLVTVGLSWGSLSVPNLDEE
jgi:hypothetical protein